MAFPEASRPSSMFPEGKLSFFALLSQKLQRLVMFSTGCMTQLHTNYAFIIFIILINKNIS